MTVALAAYYSFESNGTDATGRGNDLTLRNTPTFTAGIQGNAMVLASASAQDGAKTDTADLSIGARDYEICFWVYTTTVSGTALVVCKDNGSSQREYVIRRNAADISCYAWSGTVFSGVLTHGVTLSTNTWYFVDWYFVSATKKMALRVNDANEVSMTLNAISIDDGAAKLTVGSFDQAASPFDGRLDEMCFNAANFSAAERTDVYNAGAGRNYAYVSTIGAATGQPTMRRWGGIPGMTPGRFS